MLTSLALKPQVYARAIIFFDFKGEDLRLLTIYRTDKILHVTNDSKGN